MSDPGQVRASSARSDSRTLGEVVQCRPGTHLHSPKPGVASLADEDLRSKGVKVQIEIKGETCPSPTSCGRTPSAAWARSPARSRSSRRLEIEIFKEPNPRVADCQVAEGTLYLKGVTLRARDASPGDAALAEPDGRRARPPGEAPPRQTPPPPRGPRGRRTGGGATAWKARWPRRRSLIHAATWIPRCGWSSLPRRAQPLQAARARPRTPAGEGQRAAAAAIGHPGGSYPWPMPSLLDRALNVGEAKKLQDLPEARRADQRVRARARTRHRRRTARTHGRAARARRRRRGRSTRSCPSASRSSVRPASGRWRCATSTSS